MKNGFTKKLMTVFLAFAMLFGCFTEAVRAESSSTWKEVDDIAAAAASEKTIAITMTTGDGTVYALPTKLSTSSGPAAVTAAINGKKLVIDQSAESDFGWTIAESGTGYTISTKVNNTDYYLYVTASNNGVRVNTKPDVGYIWNINSNYLTAADSANATRYLGVYTSTPNWRCYTSINSNISGQTLQFWEFEESSSTPDTIVAQLDKFTAAPGAGSQLVIYYPKDGLAISTKASGSKLAGTNAVIEDGKLNQTEAMAYFTVELDSSSYYMFKTDDGKYLTSGSTGNSLTLSETANDYSKWTLQKQDNDTWNIVNVNAVFNNNQQALEYYSGFTTFGLQATDEKYRFELYGVPGSDVPVDPETYTVTIEPSDHGEVTASKYEGIENGEEIVLTVIPETGYELDKLLVNNAETPVSGSTVAITVTGNLIVSAVFKQIPAPEPGDVFVRVTNLEQIADGSRIIVYNAFGGKAMSTNSVATYYRGLEDVTISDNKVVEFEDTAIWNVAVTEKDGEKLYTFSSEEGNVLSAGTRNSLPYNDENTEWTIVATEAADNSYYIINAGRPSQYIEYYAAKEEFSAFRYDSANDDIYRMQLYHVAKKETPPVVTEETFGLTNTIADGDEVIIYMNGHGEALGNTLSGHVVSGVALTPEENVITTDNTGVVWTVVDNGDGTYRFTQDSKTLGGVVSGNYNNLVLTGATAVNWTLSGPDNSDLHYFMYLDEMESSHGKVYLEYYKGFTLYGSDSPTVADYGITFYKKGAEPVTPSGNTGNLVTSLSQLTEGATVAIYSPGHGTAVSSKPNGDWYLKAVDATVEDGKVINYTKDLVFNVHVVNGVYTFEAAYPADDNNTMIAVWPSGTYMELTMNPNYDSNTVSEWNVTPCNENNHTWYISSTTLANSNGIKCHIEAYVRNGTEVFSGYCPKQNQMNESEFGLQFYLVDNEEALDAYDDGTWDEILTPGEEYVIYNNDAQKSLGLFKEANYALDAIETEITDDGLAKPGNGAYVFKIHSMGRYYAFEVNGKYLATNNEEELLFVSLDEEGKIPENAKWFLKPTEGWYLIYNKDAQYGGTPVCIEYFSSVFSGWTFSTKNELAIYQFLFYKVTDDTIIHEGVVQKPAVVFDCGESRYVEQDYNASFSLDDLAETIESINIYFTVGERSVPVTDYEVSSDGKSYSFTIPAELIDGDRTDIPESFDLHVEVENAYGISYTGNKTIDIYDEPFIEELTPSPSSQTGEDFRPLISARIGNAGENPECMMYVNGEAVNATFENKVLSWQSDEDMNGGLVTVLINVVRVEDGKIASESWTFTIGYFKYQLYFGQLHSHTTYSDGSGTLETALEYVASLPKSANVQFVAFTDHSNYFDTASAANPADAMNDKSLMTDGSREKWLKYKDTVAEFNETHTDIVAIAGYEMTWSGGPGHINSFNTNGLVSRNNADLNNKNGDAGMKLYYETMNKGDSLNQFNHPGSTFGTFNDFSYRDDATDDHMFLVEVGNGEGQIGEGGYYPSYEEYIKALDKGWHLAPTNNQDNHKGRWGNANDARDVVLTNDFSEQGIYDAIRNLRVYATEDKNLQIFYTINDEPMGTVFTDENTPEKLNVSVTLFDPDSGDSIQKVELVVNGGVTAYVWDDPEVLREGLLTVELDPEYSYYFVRVTQKDGDLAVTAPIWAGHALKIGVTGITADSDEIYKNEDVTLTTSLFNNEDSEVIVKSLVYTVNGSEVIGTDTTGYTIPANGTVTADFTYAFDTAKLTTVTVTAVVEYEGKEYNYSASVELEILDSETAHTVSPISDVVAASVPGDTGYRFVIEGIVTSNASGYDQDTAFFDCIYVQDESGGICVFPVSGEYKIGDKVQIVGHTDFYQGEPELQVQTIELIGEGGTVEPTEISSAELNGRSAEGKLVSIKGTIDSYEVVNGLVQTIMVDDGTGELARVFIDGYINANPKDEVKRIREGAQIEVTGLASYDNTFNAPEGPFPRIRIRSRYDIICEPYKIIEGNNETWTKGSESGQLIVSDAPFDRFTPTDYAETGVFIVINGEKVKIDASKYQASEGSTEILLSPAYLEQLDDGRYQIEIRSIDGSATAYLTIKTETEPGPGPDPEPGGNPTPKPYQLPLTGIE